MGEARAIGPWWPWGGMGQLSLPAGAGEAVVTGPRGEIQTQVLQCLRESGRGFSLEGAWLPFQIREPAG